MGATAAAALLAVLCLLDFATTPGSYGQVAALHVAASRAAAGAAPGLPDSARTYLAVRPHAAQGFLALAAGVEESGEAGLALLRHAAMVDPRLGAARYRLAGHYLETGQVAAGIDQIRILQNLDGQLASRLTPLVLELARVPAHRATIAAHFANDPNLLRLLDQANRAGLEPEALIGLVARTDLRRMPDGVATAQRVIGEALIARGQYRRAWASWHALAGRRPSDAIFDGGFAGAQGAAPFGWTLVNDQYARTRIRAGEGPGGGGALGVDAFGSQLLTAARQNLVLGAGRHVLRFAANAGGGSDTPFFWSVKCVSGRTVSELPVPASPQWRSHEAEVIIPADCPMQVLALQKGPTMTEGPHRLLVANLRIAPL